MLEVVVAGAFVLAALVVFSRRTGSLLLGAATDDRFELDSSDLPCPWCRGPTAEEDSRCGTCGQRFG